MAETSTPSNQLQWKWVGISLLMYVVFYFLPLFLVPGGLLNEDTATTTSSTLVGIWIFAGVFIIAAVAGFISAGVTIREPFIAAVGLVILWCVVTLLRLRWPAPFSLGISAAFICVAMVVGLLSLSGAWFGERLQKAFRTKPPEGN